MGQAGGEFYTPQSVVELLVELIRPLDGIVYDPCCGTGGMFVQSVKFVNYHSDKDQKKHDIQIFGQEISPYTQRIAKINLSLRGIAAKLGSPADTFKDDQHRNLQADYILANPQFNQKKFFLDPKDPRYYELGVPPKKYGANFA
jgi:type I restriction enzyme M protein